MKTHKMLDKNIVLGTVLLLLLAFLVIGFVGAFGFWNENAKLVMSIVGGIVALFAFRSIFKDEFLGFVKGEDWKAGLKIALFMLIYYVYIVLQTLLVGEFDTLGIYTILAACVAGVVEEAVFRGYLISYWFRLKNEPKNMPYILLASSVIFGLAHGLNVFAGALVGITIMQVIGTIGIGALLGAIYMRSGNIVIVMIAHGLTDLLAFMDRSQVSESGIMTTDVSFINVIDTIICFVLLAIALYLIRPEKREEIVALWNKKWIREEANSSSLEQEV